ncbi:hypothetical protein VTN96DRAFT_8268 [Rasamsonia emersonii]
MDIAAEFSSFHEQVTSKLVQTTRTVGQLCSEDVNFHRSSSSEFAESLDEQSDRLLSLTSSLLKIATAGTDVKPPALRDEDSVEDNWGGVVDVIDSLLEKADACLDEFTGIIKRLSPSQQAQSQSVGGKATPSKFPSVYNYGASKIPKPQLQFERAPDNSDVSPFRPLLKTKPHAIVPLEESLKLVESDSQPAFYPNPYEAEIRAAKYPSSTYVASPPIDYCPFESTKATWVDTLEGVSEMLAELKSSKEIAIDLEHHDVHSYHGLVSLMQISTRDKDWIVDTLKPWREELQQLNEVFADPNILKVLHGSSMDIIWLQRDLGLYVVGMFDTYHAAVALGYPKRSLKFLLHKFVNFQADKRYQMADWRIRPLPEEMFNYARSDTHYLLYIYDHLRNQLLERSTPESNLVDYVLEQSKNEALQRYERPVYDAATGQGPGGWYDCLTKSSVPLSKEQFAVFKAVHQWRDEVAREEDEGVQCVFPRHVLFKIAQTMPLDKATLFRTISPVTTIVRDRVDHLLEVIKAAKIAGANGPEWRDVAKPTKTAVATTPAAQKVASAIDQGLPTPAEEKEALVSAGRAEISQFWGNALKPHETAAVPVEYSVAASAEALRLSLPLPPMPMTVSEAREKLGNAPAATPQPAPAAPTPAEEKSNEIFTVKEIAGRRKRKISKTNEEDKEDSSSEESDESSDADSLEEKKPSKKSRREAVAKKPSSSSSSSKQENQDSTPFDYSKAPSVLHAPAESATGGLPMNKSKQPFNPYAKALDAPTGVRKAKKDTGGKNFTFTK